MCLYGAVLPFFSQHLKVDMSEPQDGGRQMGHQVGTIAQGMEVLEMITYAAGQASPYYPRRAEAISLHRDLLSEFPG